MHRPMYDNVKDDITRLEHSADHSGYDYGSLYNAISTSVSHGIGLGDRDVVVTGAKVILLEEALRRHQAGITESLPHDRIVAVVRDVENMLQSTREEYGQRPSGGCCGCLILIILAILAAMAMGRGEEIGTATSRGKKRWHENIIVDCGGDCYSRDSRSPRGFGQWRPHGSAYAHDTVVASAYCLADRQEHCPQPKGTGRGAPRNHRAAGTAKMAR